MGLQRRAEAAGPGRCAPQFRPGQARFRRASLPPSSTAGKPGQMDPLPHHNCYSESLHVSQRYSQQRESNQQSQILNTNVVINTPPYTFQLYVVLFYSLVLDPHYNIDRHPEKLTYANTINSLRETAPYEARRQNGQYRQ